MSSPPWAGGLFAMHVCRLLVVAKPLIARLAQDAMPGPLSERDFHNKHRPHRVNVFTGRRVAFVKWIPGAGDAIELLPQVQKRFSGEASSDFSRVDQALAVLAVIADE